MRFRQFEARQGRSVNESDAVIADWQENTDHCFEYLRLFIVCGDFMVLEPDSPPSTSANLTAGDWAGELCMIVLILVLYGSGRQTRGTRLRRCLTKVVEGGISGTATLDETVENSEYPAINASRALGLRSFRRYSGLSVPGKSSVRSVAFDTVNYRLPSVGKQILLLPYINARKSIGCCTFSIPVPC